MQKAYAIFFLFLLGNVLVADLSVWADFEYNRAQIIEKLCENKDKPELQCNGHCYLAKQLQKNRQDQNLPPNSSERFDKIDFSFVALFKHGDIKPSLYALQSCKCSGFELLDGIADRVFHPPPVV